MQQNDSFRLAVRRGPQPNQAFEISKDVSTLGRDISNDIVINDRETSRHHLRIMRSGDTLTIEDLGSTNGTFVNGKRVSGVTPLQNGDMVGLGETVTLALEVYRAQDAPPEIPPSPLDQPTPVASPPPPVEPPAPAPVEPPTPAPATAAPPTDYGLRGAVPPPADPYAPPSAAPYPQMQPAQPAYQEPAPAPPEQQPAYYAAAPAGYPSAPQQYPGYDYDPYAVREESSGTSPWLILGCFVFFVLVFVCFAGIALTIIDVLNLWCEVPVLSDIVYTLNLGC